MSKTQQPQFALEFEAGNVHLLRHMGDMDWQYIDDVSAHDQNLAGRMHDFYSIVCPDPKDIANVAVFMSEAETHYIEVNANSEDIAARDIIAQHIWQVDPNVEYQVLYDPEFKRALIVYFDTDLLNEAEAFISQFGFVSSYFSSRKLLIGRRNCPKFRIRQTRPMIPAFIAGGATALATALSVGVLYLHGYEAAPYVPVQNISATVPESSPDLKLDAIYNTSTDIAALPKPAEIADGTGRAPSQPYELAALSPLVPEPSPDIQLDAIHNVSTYVAPLPKPAQITYASRNALSTPKRDDAIDSAMAESSVIAPDPVPPTIWPVFLDRAASLQSDPIQFDQATLTTSPMVYPDQLAGSIAPMIDPQTQGAMQVTTPEFSYQSNMPVTVQTALDHLSSAPSNPQTSTDLGVSLPVQAAPLTKLGQLNLDADQIIINRPNVDIKIEPLTEHFMVPPAHRPETFSEPSEEGRIAIPRLRPDTLPPPVGTDLVASIAGDLINEAIRFDAQTLDQLVSAGAAAQGPNRRPPRKSANFNRVVRRPSGGTVTSNPSASAPSGEDLIASRASNRFNKNALSLIGIFGTPSNREVYFRTITGGIRSIKQGQRIAGWQLVAVDESSVKIVRDGQEKTLQVP